jgi:hypothetical protein
MRPSRSRTLAQAIALLALTLSLASPGARAQDSCRDSLGPLEVARIHQQARVPICMACSATGALENLILARTGERIALSVPYLIVQGARIRLRKEYELWGKKIPTYAEIRIVDQDFILSAAREFGIVPEAAWTPTTPIADWDDKKFNLAHILGVVKTALTQFRFPNSTEVRAMFDRALFERSGTPPETFIYEGKTYTPVEFAREKLPEFQVKQIQVEGMKKDNVRKTEFSDGGLEVLPVDEAVERIASQINQGISVPLVISYNGEFLKGDVFAVPPEKKLVYSFTFGKDFRHGMTAINYLRDDSGKIEYLVLQDSKGVRRGKGGLIRIHRSYFVPFLRRFQQISLF